MKMSVATVGAITKAGILNPFSTELTKIAKNSFAIGGAIVDLYRIIVVMSINDLSPR